MEDQTTMRHFGDHPEPCIAGTLALMSNYRRNHCPQLAQKIVHNLFVLSQQNYFSPEFRLALAQLHADWLPDAQGTAAPTEGVEKSGGRQSPLH